MHQIIFHKFTNETPGLFWLAVFGLTAEGIKTSCQIKQDITEGE